MNISNFKEGDVITREEPTLRGDRSYQNDRMIFVGTENGMIVLVNEDTFLENKIVKLETDWWSEGWNYYPQLLVDKAKKIAAKLITKKEAAPKDDLS